MVTPGIDYETYWSNDCRTAPFFHALLSDGNNIVVPERSREEYHRQKANYPSPTSLLLEPMLTYSGAGYWHGGFRVTTGGPKRESYETTLRTAHELLAIHRPWITDWDYKKVLSQLGQDSFAFLDPPYLNANVTAYKPSDLDHREMVSLLLTAKYRWILCEYDNALYTEAFGQPFWRRDMQICMTTRYKADKAVRRIGTECMWRNF
jgi:site-specific DNA-adenine methylase